MNGYTIYLGYLNNLLSCMQNFKHRKLKENEPLDVVEKLTSDINDLVYLDRLLLRSGEDSYFLISYGFLNQHIPKGSLDRIINSDKPQELRDRIMSNLGSLADSDYEVAKSSITGGIISSGSTLISELSSSGVLGEMLSAIQDGEDEEDIDSLLNDDDGDDDSDYDLSMMDEDDDDDDDEYDEDIFQTDDDEDALMDDDDDALMDDDEGDDEDALMDDDEAEDIESDYDLSMLDDEDEDDDEEVFEDDETFEDEYSMMMMDEEDDEINEDEFSLMVEEEDEYEDIDEELMVLDEDEEDDSFNLMDYYEDSGVDDVLASMDEDDDDEFYSLDEEEEDMLSALDEEDDESFDGGDNYEEESVYFDDNSNLLNDNNKTNNFQFESTENKLHLNSGGNSSLTKEQQSNKELADRLIGISDKIISSPASMKRVGVRLIGGMISKEEPHN